MFSEVRYTFPTAASIHTANTKCVQLERSTVYDPCSVFRPSRHIRRRANQPPPEYASLLSDIIASLTETFGDRALLVARSQPPFNYVGDNIGISWGEVTQVLSTTIARSGSLFPIT